MELDNNHRRFLLNYLRNRGCTSEDAQDIAQEVLLKVWQSYHKGIEDMNAWMAALAHNTMITHWRKTVVMRRKGAISKEVHLPEVEQLLGSYELTDGPLQLQELKSYIARIDRPIYRQLLELFLQGYELHEIAEMTGMKQPNVKTKVHRAKLALLEIVNET